MASSGTATYHQVVVKRVAIHTTVADTVELVNTSIEELRTHLASKPKKLVGLDCEWRPYDEYFGTPNKVALLQLCSDNICVIIQLFYVEYIRDSLRSFLSDPELTFVGVRIGEDVEKLRNDYGLFVCRSTDIVELAMSKGYGRVALRRKSTLGLKDLAMEVVGITLDKSKRLSMSDWQMRVLSSDRIRYACLDAYASYSIGSKLLMDV